MDNYYVVIALALVGFAMLAAALLVPVYFFLKKEERTAERWTDESLANSGASDGRQEGQGFPKAGVVSTDGLPAEESRAQ